VGQGDNRERTEGGSKRKRERKKERKREKMESDNLKQ